MKKRGFFHSEGYHWFSAFMGFLGTACLIHAQVWRIQTLAHWQIAFMFVFLAYSGGTHFSKAIDARREKRGHGG